MPGYPQWKRDLAKLPWLWLADHRQLAAASRPVWDESSPRGLCGNYGGRIWKQMPGKDKQGQCANFFLYRRGLLVVSSDPWVEVDEAVELSSGGWMAAGRRKLVEQAKPSSPTGPLLTSLDEDVDKDDGDDAMEGGGGLGEMENLRQMMLSLYWGDDPVAVP